MIDVVIALIEKDGRICVGERLTEPFAHFFECPGGKRENDESLLDALKREIYEEGQATLKSAAYITHYDVCNEHGDFKLHWYKVELEDDFKPIIYKEVLWVKADQIKNLNWIPHNLPYLSMMEKALFLKPQEIKLVNPTINTLIQLLKDDSILIKKIHLEYDEPLLNDEIVDLIKLYSMDLIILEN